MARILAFGGVSRPAARNLRSLACLAFVLVLGTAFWAGALWIGQMALRLSSGF